MTEARPTAPRQPHFYLFLTFHSSHIACVHLALHGKTAGDVTGAYDTVLVFMGASIVTRDRICTNRNDQPLVQEERIDGCPTVDRDGSWQE